MAWKRTAAETTEALDIQRRAIVASCAAYDNGEKWEALRLATAVYLVVHDGGKNNKSLLTQLGIRDATKFMASAAPANPNNLLRETPLLQIRIGLGGQGGGAKGEYVPRLGEIPEEHRYVSFPQWWERDLIFRNGQYSLTRRKLVFTLRSQEGEAHFDMEQKNPNYERLAREHITTPRLLKSGSRPQPIMEAELASMRQISWELAATLGW